jgi:erythromycin esterase-like protein
MIDQVARLVAERAPRVVGLGEPMHGVEAFPALRNAMLERMPGCRTVAIESECLADPRRLRRDRLPPSGLRS